jgi:hypothetical protein
MVEAQCMGKRFIQKTPFGKSAVQFSLHLVNYKKSDSSKLVKKFDDKFEDLQNKDGTVKQQIILNILLSFGCSCYCLIDRNSVNMVEVQ